MDEAGVVVVGAGVVGLAVARELAAGGHETLILEAQAHCGSGASSRNSEVIHAGIYYTPGSLKARLCSAGREQLYAYCARRAIAHRRCGKLIVATGEAQLTELERLAATAQANGVSLEWLTASEARALEPHLHCIAALHSPHSGILDSHAYLGALRADAEQNGAQLVTRCRVTRIVPEGATLRIGVNGEQPALRARRLVNCAGVGAPAVAGLIEGLAPQHVPRAFFAKGSYFALRGAAPFSRLVYPVPPAGSLGIHLTLDLAGRARFGPDLEWLDEIDLEVRPERSAAFYAAVRRYWPGLPRDALEPAYAGMRARITGPGEPPADFRIDGPERHGIAALVNLFGIESPGLTASLALAREAVSRLR